MNIEKNKSSGGGLHSDSSAWNQ